MAVSGKRGKSIGKKLKISFLQMTWYIWRSGIMELNPTRSNAETGH
jgi:hypothetical protein